jgi:hypothetical protein
MCIHRVKRAIFGAGIIVLLIAACNQLDTVLPSGGTYQVDAINGGFSLNDYSVIAAGDTVRPYFVNPVTNDPDMRALVLYVEDSQGGILGSRVIYSPDSGSVLLPPFRGERVSDTAKGDGGSAGAVLQEDDVTVPVKNFAGKLPPFPLPDKLEIGAYSLIFEIRGEQTVLNRISQPFHYIGDRKFTTGEIRYYLPEFNEHSRMASPGLTVMLEAQVDYGEGLDPYIVWYNGKNNIGEGFAAAGAVRLLWAVPPRSGFHTIRAEFFPSEPRAGQKGKIKEFSLPVSQKNKAGSGPAAGDYLYWYRFAGDLLDAKTGRGLNPVQEDKASLSWYPAGQVYGLVLDKGESYEAPSHFLNLSENGGDRLGFFIRALPLEDGNIFSARLGSFLWVNLSLEGEVLFLDLKEQNQTSRISKAFPDSERGPAFTGVFITVKFDKSRVSASLELGLPDEAGGSWPGMGDDELSDGMPIQNPAEWAEIDLGLPLSGEMRSWIGADPESRPEAGAENPPSGSSEKPAVLPPVLVLDDFAALFRAFRGGAKEADGTLNQNNG